MYKAMQRLQINMHFFRLYIAAVHVLEYINYLTVAMVGACLANPFHLFIM